MAAELGGPSFDGGSFSIPTGPVGPGGNPLGEHAQRGVPPLSREAQSGDFPHPPLGNEPQIGFVEPPPPVNPITTTATEGDQPDAPQPPTEKSKTINEKSTRSPGEDRHQRYRFRDEIKARYRAWGQRGQFPYDYREGPLVFRGGHGLLEGHLDWTTNDVYLGNGDTEILVEEEVPFVDLHFNTRESGYWDGRRQKLVKRLRKGAEDLLDLTEQLDTNLNLRLIKLFTGTTSLEMAQVAVQNLGFHYGNPVVVQNHRFFDDIDHSVIVFTTRPELLAQAPHLQELRERMKSIEKRGKKKK